MCLYTQDPSPKPMLPGTQRHGDKATLAAPAVTGGCEVTWESRPRDAVLFVLKTRLSCVCKAPELGAKCVRERLAIGG